MPRALKKGVRPAGSLLAGLGVSYVISGDFSGWNLGMAHGGFGGLLIAFAAMGIMYACMVFGLAEMSSALPTAGAGYGFARRALGKLGGYATGIAILIEYSIAPAAISVFIGGYVESLGLFPGLSPIVIYGACFALFIAIHLIGVGEALKVMFVITAIAIVALIAFVTGMIPHFDAANLLNIAADGSAGSSSFLPFGVSGVLAALPFGIWFFLAVEGVPLAAEEANDPKKDMPKGIIAAMAVLVITGLSVLLLCPGGAGAALMSESGAPLPDALNAGGDWPGHCPNYAVWRAPWPRLPSCSLIRASCSRCLAPAICPVSSVTNGRKTPMSRQSRAFHGCHSSARVRDGPSFDAPP